MADVLVIKLSFIRLEKCEIQAKFCIADESVAYIGSANLTFLGLQQHLEMGVLLHDEMAKKVSDFWKLLVLNEFFILDNTLFSNTTLV